MDDMSEMSDNLRNVRQTMMRLLTRQPESDSFMRDEEGSGDGPEPRYPGDDEENYGHEGSGSGEEPVGKFWPMVHKIWYTYILYATLKKAGVGGPITSILWVS